MGTQVEFAANVAEVLSSLKTAQAQIAQETAKKKDELHNLRLDYNRQIQRDAERVLPDLRKSTTGEFRRAFLHLRTPAINRALEKADRFVAPWYARFMGGAEAYKHRALSDDLSLLRIHLSLSIASMHYKYREFDTLTTISKKMFSTENHIADLEQRKARIEEQVSALTRAMQRALFGKGVIPRTAVAAIARSAEKSREGPRDGSFITDILIPVMILNSLTGSNNTVLNEPAPFKPGGGDSGGGGFDLSATPAREELVETPDQSNPQPNEGSGIALTGIAPSVTESPIGDLS